MGTVSRRRTSLAVSMRSLYQTFVHSQIVGGVILIICAALALVVANVPSLSHYGNIWDEVLSVSVADFSIEMTLGAWVNDGLMAVFFFVVGLEIKRELLVGELSSIRHASLPIFAALGGMIVPAIIYMFFNNGTEGANGWGIPMATDIAFALGILSLLGDRVPVSLKVFLTALAIVDDLGAIVVLAVFYPSHALHPELLFYAILLVCLLYFAGRAGMRSVLVYVVGGIVLWYLVYRSGIHATISGVFLAMTVPSKTKINEVRFFVRMKSLLLQFKNAGHSEVSVLSNYRQQDLLHSMTATVNRINPMMHKFEFAMHPWVTFFIMPLFALANAGVVFDSQVFSLPLNTVASGVSAGLFIGKPVGIFLMCLAVVKTGLAVLPEGVTWGQIFSAGVLAGIGFTMSIFIDGLAFSDPGLVNVGKAAILITSFFSALAGMLALYLTSRRKGRTI